jgi:uncharacterized membrane protein
MDIGTSKILGGIGALLMFIGFIPGVPVYGGLPLIGLILVLVALWGLAGYFKDAGIFNNALIGSIAGVAGILVFAAVVLLAAVGFVSTIVPGWNGDWTSLSNINPGDISSNVTLEIIGPFLATILIAVVVLFLVFVAVAYFYRKSLKILADKTGVGMFRTTGTLLLVGAVLTIILIGIILIWIAMLLLAIAFFSMRTQQPQPPTSAPTQTPTQV